MPACGPGVCSLSVSPRMVTAMPGYLASASAWQGSLGMAFLFALLLPILELGNPVRVPGLNAPAQDCKKRLRLQQVLR
jgi:hypothetical protein